MGSIAQRDQDGGFLAVFTLACAQTDAGGDQWRIPVSFPENEIEQGEDCWDVPLLVLFSHDLDDRIRSADASGRIIGKEIYVQSGFLHRHE